jgi:hypothetical protein
MWLSRKARSRGQSRRRWWFSHRPHGCLATVVFVLIASCGGARSEPSLSPRPVETHTPGSARNPRMGRRRDTGDGSRRSGHDISEAPRTVDYRKLASAAAKAIYTWDTRTASYSEVYSRLRNWWNVLPDGSNPLTVFVQEFEATGINAGSYASLAGSRRAGVLWCSLFAATSSWPRYESDRRPGRDCTCAPFPYGSWTKRAPPATCTQRQSAS